MGSMVAVVPAPPAGSTVLNVFVMTLPCVATFLCSRGRISEDFVEAMLKKPDNRGGTASLITIETSARVETGIEVRVPT